MRRRLLWLTLVAVPILAVGLVTLVALEARDRLPELLAWAVREMVPGVELEVASVRLEARDRIIAHGVVVRMSGAEAPAFEADRLQVEFDLSELWERRLRLVRLDRPVVVWTAETHGSSSVGGEGEAEPLGWTLGSLRAVDGHLEVAAPPETPPVVFDFELDLTNVGDSAESTALVRDLSVSNLRVGPREQPLLTTVRLDAKLSVDGVRRGAIESIHLAPAKIDLSAALPEFASDGEESRAERTFSVGHLVIEDSRLSRAALADQPGFECRIALDLREVGDAPKVADRVQTIEVSDLRVFLPGSSRPAMLSVPRLSADVSIAGLTGQRVVEAVRVSEGTLLLDGQGRNFFLATEGGGGNPSGDAWRIGALEIGSLGVHLSELGPPLPDVTFDVHTTLTDLPLSAAAAAIADERQQIELASLGLYSPFDPFKKVVTIGSAFIDFSLGGLTEQKVHQVKLVRPTIYLSEDLFWYMTNERADATSSPASPWTIDVLKAELGSLILEIGKARRVGLPITFETEVRDVKLDNLADLKLAAQLHVPEESYTFPDYDVSLERVRGELQFDYPPGEGSENFVSTLYADAFEWRDYGVSEGWLSLTFDRKGIDGTFGGMGYAGYVNGGITVPYALGEPWVGWVSASDIDLTEFTAVLAGGAVEMSGPLDANIALTIANQTLETAKGDLTLAEAGRLELTRLDESQIPKDWAGWKRDLGEIALETLKNFDYDSGRGRLDFDNGVGLATLDLAGPAGGRNLKVRYHGSGSDPHTLDARVSSREDGS